MKGSFGLSYFFISLCLSLLMACNDDTKQAHPYAPEGFRVSERTTTTLSFTWDAAMGPGGSHIESYQVAYRIKGVSDYFLDKVSTKQQSHTFIGLKPATTYQVQIQAKDTEGKYGDIATLEVKTAASPSTPAEVLVSYKGRNFLSLLWTSSTDPDGNISSYYISYKKKDQDTYSKEVETSKLSYTLSGLIEGEMYEVRLRAKDNEGYYSGYTIIKDKTLPKGVPTVPTRLSVSDTTQTSFKISWSAATDPDGGISSYHVSYREKESGTYGPEIITEDLTYHLNDLTPGSTYQVRVRSKDLTGYYSDYAVVEAATTPPSMLSVSHRTKTSLSLSWMFSTNLDDKTIKYHISHREPGNNNYITDTITALLSYTLRGLKPATDYQVRVRAIDNTGYYGDHLTLEAETLVPPTISTLSSHRKQTSLILNWSASISPSLSIVGYDFSYREKDSDKYSPDTTITDQSYTLRGLELATYYQVRVRAIDNTGYYGDYVTLETATLSPPTAPTLSSHRKQTGLTISWSASMSPGSNIVGYDFSYREKGSGNYSPDITITDQSYTLSGLKLATYYQVRVRAIDKTGYYGDYATLETKTLTPPTVPTLSMNRLPQASLRLSWTASTSPDTSIASYLVSYRKKGEDSYQPEIETTYLTYTLNELIPRVTYQIRVRVKDDAGYYSDYAMLQVTTTFDFTYGDDRNDKLHNVIAATGGGFVLLGSLGETEYDNDIQVVKLDVQGKQVWQKIFGRVNVNEKVRSISSTVDGGYFLAGSTNASANHNMLAIKLDKEGNQLWYKTFGMLHTREKAYTMAPTLDGNFLLVGSTSAGTTNYNLWVVKIDGQGNQIWDKIISNKLQYLEGREISPTPDGGFIISCDYINSSYDYDSWVVKIDGQGNQIWDKTISVGSKGVIINGLISVDDGYVLIGKSYDDVLLVVKLDHKGNQVWNKMLEGGVVANAVISTADGGYLVAGETKSKATGSGESWLVKIDSKGGKVWDKTFGRGMAKAIISTADGGYLVAGETKSKGAEDFDMWVFKVDKDGNL